jgi:hypothetical protein
MNQPPFPDPNQPQPAFYDPNDPNQAYYDPNEYAPADMGGQPPQGYTRVQAPTKAGDKYKGTGKKGKRPKDPRAPNPWANMGIWIVGLGLPIMLVYFAIQKLFVDKIEVQYDPYPAVLLEKERDKELIELGQTIATQLREGRKDELVRHVIWDEVIYRVSRNMELTLRQSTDVRDELKTRWVSDNPGLFRQILGGDIDRMPAQFVKIRQRDGYPCLLLRTMPKEGRVQYFDFLLVPVRPTPTDGEAAVERLRIVDIWDCQRAMFASDAIRREVIREVVATDESTNRPWKAVFGENLTKEQILAIKSMIGLDALNKPSTLADLRELPETFQKSAQGYDIAIHAYQHLLDSISTADQLEAFKKRLSDPPTLPASLGSDAIVTGALLAEVETKLENKGAIDGAWLKAYKEIGKDPYLKVVAGKRRLATGDVPGAEAMASEVQKENRQLSELQELKNAIEKKRAP